MKRLALAAVMLILLPPDASAQALAPVKVEVPERYERAFGPGRTLMALPGMRVSVYAAGLRGARFMASSADGTIFLSVPRKGTVVALPDRDNDGVADDAVTFAGGLDRPHGLAFRGSGLMVAESGGVVMLNDTDNDLKADERKEVADDIPSGGGHWTRTVVIGPDGALYVSVGSSCNACTERDGRRASVLRFDGSKAERFARGLRNSVGIEFHPETGELWGVDNGRDLIGDDLPPEELNRIVKGGDYGWPYCYGKKIPDPEHGSMERCADTVGPVVEMQAHSAPLGVAFGYALKGFPEGLKDALYVAFHGSWNRTEPTGYKLVAIPFKEGRPSGRPFDVVTGWLNGGEEAWGRPVDPFVGPDGALYLSDDEAGAVYRITYDEGG